MAKNTHFGTETGYFGTGIAMYGHNYSESSNKAGDKNFYDETLRHWQDFY